MKKKTKEVAKQILAKLERDTCAAFVQAQGPTPLHIAYGIMPKKDGRPRTAILTLSTDERATSYLVPIPAVAAAIRRYDKHGARTNVQITCVERIDSDLPRRAMNDPDWMLTAPAVPQPVDAGDLCAMRGVWLAAPEPS